MLLPTLTFLAFSFSPPQTSLPIKTKTYCIDQNGQVYETYGTCSTGAPGPLPLVGAGVAFTMSRKLRARIKNKDTF